MSEGNIINDEWVAFNQNGMAKWAYDTFDCRTGEGLLLGGSHNRLYNRKDYLGHPFLLGFKWYIKEIEKSGGEDAPRA